MTDARRALDTLFDRLFRMSDAELRILRLAWEDESQEERARAWASARPLLDDPARAELLERARSALATWVNSYLSATAIEYGSFLINPGSGMNPSEVRRGAIPPVMDAAVAIIAGDELEPSEREVLLAPVSELVDRPARF